MELMFDIYTTESDGTMLLLESVACLTRARDTALRLSMLFPDQSFAYVERSPGLHDFLPVAEEVEVSAFRSQAMLPLPC